MQRIEIEPNKPLQPGDIIEMEFSSVGMLWIQAAQLALIEWRLADRSDFTILNHSVVEKTKIIFKIRIDSSGNDEMAEVEIQEAAIITTAVVIGAAILAAGAIAWLTLDKVYQIITEPAGQVLVGGIGAIGIAVAIAIIVPLMTKGR